MADFSEIKTQIQTNIKTNGNQEITGAVLQETLIDIVDEIDANLNDVNLFPFVGYDVEENGTISATVATIAASDFLPIDRTKTLTLVAGWRNSNSAITPYAFYDRNKKFILSYLGPGEASYTYIIDAATIPENAEYIRCTVALNAAGVTPQLQGYDYSQILEIKKTDKFTNAYSEAFTGYPQIISGQLYSFDGGTGQIKKSPAWDMVMIPILGESSEIKKIVVEGASPTYYLFFSTPYVSTTYLAANRSGNIPIGAKFCVIDFEVSHNPQGYDNMRILQQESGATREEIEELPAIQETLTDYDRQLLSSTSVQDGYFVHPSTGANTSNASFRITSFAIPDGASKIGIECYIAASGIDVISFFTADQTYIGGAIRVMSDSGEYISQEVDIPTGASIVKVSNNLIFDLPIVASIAKKGLYDISAISRAIGLEKKSIKLNLLSIDGTNGGELFRIRSRYNQDKDILLIYYQNYNGLISPQKAYIGSNTLSDEDLMEDANLISTHSDSTAPLFQCSEYWHLFAQHGYLIPLVANTVNMTSADVGSVWEDQLSRRYTVGKVTSSYICLLPVFSTTPQGEVVRDWKTPYEAAITTLTHISGGVVTDIINVASVPTDQIRPIMKSENRTFFGDGKEITETGTYYLNEFSVSETQIGYDPATIQSWFPVDFNGADIMAIFTWSYNFCGPQCCVNTTIDIRKKVRCYSYGATQQQFFFNNGNYVAKFLIPKAAPRNGVELDKLFASPSSSSEGYTFYRNSSSLKDVDKLIDRQIGVLHNENDDTYLAGMAAGLSLVSGDTIPEKRNQNIPLFDSSLDSGPQRVGSISPSNTNKFYIAAVNTSPFASDNYRLPDTYFKEINYYVSYFDPDENPGQVYWYKDGEEYIIYIHQQSVLDRQSIILPDIMEGRALSIIEQTEGITLLTNRVSNGKIMVSTNSTDANYIVLKAL